jgi:hypothetical protein
MVTKDANGQYYENGVPVFTLGQVCKFINYPSGRNTMIKDFQKFGILLKRNEPSERMKTRRYFIYHLHEYKTNSGVKMGEPIALATIEGVAFLKKYIKRKLVTLNQ